MEKKREQMRKDGKQKTKEEVEKENDSGGGRDGKMKNKMQKWVKLVSR